jgi:hypothetical protein
MAAKGIGKAALAAGGAALLASSPAVAGDHYYFNKPGVTREAYAADVAECAELAAGARAKPQGMPVYVTYQNTAAGAAGAAIGLLFVGLLSGSAAKKERRMMRRVVERTCMADKGYARMAVEDEVVEDIDKVAEDSQRLDRMFALAASAKPIGKRIKE